MDSLFGQDCLRAMAVYRLRTLHRELLQRLGFLMSAFWRGGGAPYSPAGGWVSNRDSTDASLQLLSNVTLTCSPAICPSAKARLAELGVEGLEDAGSDEVRLGAVAASQQVVARADCVPARGAAVNHVRQRDELAQQRVVREEGMPSTTSATLRPLTVTCCRKKLRENSSAILSPIACIASASLAQLPRPVGIVVLK
jgi:hypothetical protein